ncbi:serine hydrolase [Roseovarius aestuarii]|nr:serine hydrolase [Roseovarius aestuarii]
MTTSKRIYSALTSDTGSICNPGGDSLIFPYWSFTKTVIAVCALRLVEDGKLTLDKPLSGWDATLRQLMNHTSGLPDYGPLTAYKAAVRNGDNPWARDDMMRAAMAQGLLFAPGTGWSYSNIGYMLIRELVEDTTGRPLAEVIRHFITDPLDLKSIELATTSTQFSSVFWDAANGYDPAWVYPGCLTGNASDAAHLLHALMTGILLNDATLRQMCVAHPVGGAISGRPWTRCGYGLGLMYGKFGAAERAIGHSGAGPFCVNAVYHFPDRDIPVTVASFADGCDEGVAEFAAVQFDA